MFDYFVIFCQMARILLKRLQYHIEILLFHIWFIWNSLLNMFVLFLIEGFSSITEICLA